MLLGMQQPMLRKQHLDCENGWRPPGEQLGKFRVGEQVLKVGEKMQLANYRFHLANSKFMFAKKR